MNSQDDLMAAPTCGSWWGCEKDDLDDLMDVIRQKLMEEPKGEEQKLEYGCGQKFR